MIEFKNVSKWYGSFQVLKQCTTRVDKGQVVVVCGPSGSGKSTLIKCVNGLEPFQEGEIVVNGEGVLTLGVRPNIVVNCTSTDTRYDLSVHIPSNAAFFKGLQG